MTSKFFSPEELAVSLGVSKRSILRQVQAGKLPHFKWGGNRRGRGVIRFTEQMVKEIIDMWSHPPDLKAKHNRNYRDFEQFRKEVGE